MICGARLIVAPLSTENSRPIRATFADPERTGASETRIKALVALNPPGNTTVFLCQQVLNAAESVSAQNGGKVKRAQNWEGGLKVLKPNVVPNTDKL